MRDRIRQITFKMTNRSRNSHQVGLQVKFSFAHSFSKPLTLIRVPGVLEPIPAFTGQKTGKKPPDRSPGQRRAKSIFWFCERQIRFLIQNVLQWNILFLLCVRVKRVNNNPSAEADSASTTQQHLTSHRITVVNMMYTATYITTSQCRHKHSWGSSPLRQHCILHWLAVRG